MLAALFARTFKEAQGYLSQLLLVPMVPGFLLAFGSVDEQVWMRATPLLGHQILAAEILSGAPPALAEVALLALSTIAVAALCMLATARVFDRERLLSAGGGAERSAISISRRRSPIPRRAPRPRWARANARRFSRRRWRLCRSGSDRS
ncbi:MAG TPA: hypothetical protein VGS22_24035 [Thermoanaerobaculia bacterium]|jgi:hypothetical protein|nr:hypothetical protein [Thermoanaerobaculia bacterium]